MTEHYWLIYPISFLIVATYGQPLLPFKIKSDCFINYIIENNKSEVTHVLDQEHYTEWTYSWTLYDVWKLDFGIDKEQLLDDHNLTLQTGYFRFSFKYRKPPCLIFILLTDTFNATANAIYKSGYGTSETTPFFIGIKDDGNGHSSEILRGFENLPDSDLGELGFHSQLFFFSLERNLNSSFLFFAKYCYFCTRREKFQEIHLETYRTKPISTHKDWNSPTKVAFYTVGKKVLEQTDLTSEYCTRRGWNLYDTLHHCNFAELLVMNMLSTVMNVSFTEFRNFAEEDEDLETTSFYLNVIWKETQTFTVKNVIAATRGSYHSIRESKVKFIYCGKVSQMSNLSWMIYITIFDLPIWTCYIGILVLFSIFYKDLAKGFDLSWAFLGYDFWFKHPRSMIAIYLVAMFFLRSIYDSLMSTDFITLEPSKSHTELLQIGFKIWTENAQKVDQIFNHVPPFFKRKIESFIGKGKTIGDAVYKSSKGRTYKLPNNTLELIEEMVKEKIILTDIIRNYNLLTQLFASSMERAVIDTKYLCETVKLPKEIGFVMGNSYRIWGHKAGEVSSLLGKWNEMGLNVRMQSLLSLKTLLTQQIQWYEASKVAEESSFGLNSPLGMACLCEVMVVLGTALGFAIYYGLYAFERRVSTNDDVIRIDDDEIMTMTE
ncbi:unnamed protein product [Orchesella dallaii]|uniref:Uncharacterized protein n=1 Tax=Orchesella dallaii TaxID=48710 RepID=A0ABP1QL81_9HEXA